MRMKEKVALVIGGTSGLGRRMVERYVEEGATELFAATSLRQVLKEVLE